MQVVYFRVYSIAAEVYFLISKCFLTFIRKLKRKLQTFSAKSALDAMWRKQLYRSLVSFVPKKGGNGGWASDFL